MRGGPAVLWGVVTSPGIMCPRVDSVVPLPTHPAVAFKSTEPYLLDYVTLDLHQAIQEQGFQAPLQMENSPRHRTVVAVKPKQ